MRKSIFNRSIRLKVLFSIRYSRKRRAIRLHSYTKAKSPIALRFRHSILARWWKKPIMRPFSSFFRFSLRLTMEALFATSCYISTCDGIEEMGEISAAQCELTVNSLNSSVNYSHGVISLVRIILRCDHLFVYWRYFRAYKFSRWPFVVMALRLMSTAEKNIGGGARRNKCAFYDCTPICVRKSTLIQKITMAREEQHECEASSQQRYQTRSVRGSLSLSLVVIWARIYNRVQEYKKWCWLLWNWTSSPARRWPVQCYRHIREPLCEKLILSISLRVKNSLRNCTCTMRFTCVCLIIPVSFNSNKYL